MKTDLDELIEQLESERGWLQKQIADYIDEAGYWYASHHQRALEEVEYRLGLLNAFKNPNYYEIQHLESYLPRYQQYVDKKVKHSNSEALRDLYEKRIDQSRQKLRLLKEKTHPPLYDEQIIDEALFSLVQEKVKGFSINVDFEEYDYKLTFCLTDDLRSINISLTGLLEIDEAEQEKDGHLDIELTLNRFKKIGFDWINRQLIYHYQVHKFKDALEIKTMLSRLFFEVFHNTPNSVSLIYDE